ncbi:DUF3592 domain-containing protein [Flagellimonas sp. 389]|uniref:DUF3592 domain-containing protein n=1 Tax=Flagellimonas sp. 389 TaxID=2835862 RepID=UPI001BD352A9|nr:DUF3592 domain-containing protein [Flagellimonas sp. 389]MBS9461407.1 DUF3592 domain-containing protein [Flagellimonas sp. 389]
MSKNKSMLWIIFYLLLFLIGTFLAYNAYTKYQKTQHLLEKGIKTTATVIQFHTHQSDGSTMYKPVFEFKDRSQTKRTFESAISSNPPAYKVGEKVKIIYDKNDSGAVKTISFWGLYRWSVILFMIAAPFLIIGGSYLLYASR